MEDKKQNVNHLKEWQKVINEFRNSIEDIGNKLAKLLPNVEISEEEEDTWEMKCPFEGGDEYYLLKSFGDFQKMEWTNHLFDELALIQGNIFTNEEAVELEIKRRNLLTRFKSFRDECNGDWEADWTNGFEDKFFISFNIFSDTIDVRYARVVNGFYIFGYFKNKQDAERAIELFGDEIKELFVEGD